MSEARNLMLAVAASVVIMFGWKVIYERFVYNGADIHNSADMESVIPSAEDVVEYSAPEKIESSAPRAQIGNSKIRASVSLIGAVLDAAHLTKYQASLDENADNVVLMSPEGSGEDCIAEFGWISPAGNVLLPNKDTVWEAVEEECTENLLSLRWNNENGVIFRLKLALDQEYMFTVSQEIENNTNSELNLAYYGRINKLHDATDKSYWISHEGAIGGFSKGLQEWTYKDLRKENGFKVTETTYESSGKNWIGMADKYWFTALIPSSAGRGSFRAKYVPRNGLDYFQVDFSKSYKPIPPGGKSTAETYMFVGAKELNLLDMYKKTLNIPLLDKAVDFGVLYFITKPVFLMLEYFYKVTGNFGLAIVILTIVMKLAVLPLSVKSHVSMFKLKKLQPEISRIKELYKTDDLRVSKEVSALFKKYNISPISGFVPILIQIPVFFALYKVLFVTIEMRHAPLFGWIQDLSSQDAANVLNLFGMLPFHPPICIGVLPVILGVTMALQQKLSQADNASQDSVGIMKFLPYIFVFIFSSFPAGLVLYWTCSNIITILQQMVLRYYLSSKERRLVAS